MNFLPVLVTPQAAGSLGPDALTRGARTVAGHLLMIVVVLVIVLVSLGTVLAGADLKGARAEAILDARYQAETAAGVIESALKESASTVGGAASQPGLALISRDPSLCTLAGSGVGVFFQGRLDIAGSGGAVLCSSLGQTGTNAGMSYSGTGWFVQVRAAKAPILSAPFRDRLTTRYAVAVAAPFKDERGAFAGAFVHTLYLDGVSQRLAGDYGGRRGFAFSVVDTDAASVLSSSSNPLVDGTHVGGTPFAHRRSGSWRGFDGDVRLFGSTSVPGTSWRVFAGIERSRALAPAWSRVRGQALVFGVALMLLFWLAYLVNRRIGRPIRRLTAAVKQAGRDVTPAPVHVEGPLEIAELVEAFNDMVRMRSAAEERLTHQALHDPLTGLPNRELLLSRLRTLILRSSREARPALLFIDLDRFRVVNDSLGHTEGDHLLQSVADRLSRALRPADTVARFGGDEFVVLCEDLSSAEQAGAVAERVEQIFAEPFVRADGEEVRLSASIGIAFAESSDVNAEDVLRDADAAMSKAKLQGRNRHEFFNSNLRLLANGRLELENDLRRAVQREEFSVAYQPVVDLSSGRVTSVEALVRWNHPIRGFLPPVTFIPIAEETGLIHDIGNTVLVDACKQAAEWARNGDPVGVSVNVSARELTRKGFVRGIAHALAKEGLPAERLTLELTESILITDPVAATEVLRALRDLGVKVSIDDFGTGYSSLNYLQRFPIDQLKIDRSFVRDLEPGSTRAALVAAIIEMGKALGMNVVAEGVESESQADLLRSFGCSFAQGFHYSRPVSAEDAGAKIRSAAQQPALAVLR